MRQVDEAVRTLDPASAARVRPALAWLEARSVTEPSPALVREFLTRELPRDRATGDRLDRGRARQDREPHEVAWSLGDLFERAGLAEQAAACRAPRTHEALALWRWVGSFAGVPHAFWEPAVAAARHLPPGPPRRVALSVAGARAVLDLVGDGLALTHDGQLPLEDVRALDDRFRWTEEFPWMRVTQERDIAPLRLLHTHLLAQRLLRVDGARLARTAQGVRASADDALLWRMLVDPSPRWVQPFDRDALGVLAGAVLRVDDFSLGRVAEEMTHVLTARWQAVSPSLRGSVFDGAAAVAQSWYQLGVPLGWWDTGRGPADRRPSDLGQAAAATVLRAVAGPTPVRPGD